MKTPQYHLVIHDMEKVLDIPSIPDDYPQEMKQALLQIIADLPDGEIHVHFGLVHNRYIGVIIEPYVLSFADAVPRFHDLWTNRSEIGDVFVVVPIDVNEEDCATCKKTFCPRHTSRLN